jgi:hypothetical protein
MFFKEAPLMNEGDLLIKNTFDCNWKENSMESSSTFTFQMGRTFS